MLFTQPPDALRLEFGVDSSNRSTYKNHLKEDVTCYTRYFLHVNTPWEHFKDEAMVNHLGLVFLLMKNLSGYGTFS